MIIEEIRNIKSGKKELREFGIAFGIVLALLGGFFLWRGGEFYFYLLTFSAIFLFLGLILPALLRPVHKVWMTFATIIGWVITGIILSFLFYLVVTPIGLILRLFGKDILGLKFNKNTANSYWIPKEITEFKREDYERQF